MKQVNIPEEAKVKLDYDRPGMPFTATLLQPVLYKDGETYCCALGPSLEDGIFGFGKTPEEATQDWDEHLKERIEIADPADEIVMEVKQILRQHAEKDSPIHTTLPQRKDGPPDTATDDRREGTDPGIPSVSPERRNTTDQTNTDGSE